MQARVNAPTQVRHDGVRPGEIDDDIGIAQAGEVVPTIYRRHQREVISGLHGGANRRAHPAPGTKNTNPERVGRRATGDRGYRGHRAITDVKS